MVAGFLLVTIVPAPPRRPPPGPGLAQLVATPVSGAPQNERVGALKFRRGWHLTSTDPRFGGVSAMHVSNARVIALSDTGVITEFALPPTEGGRSPVRFTPLAGPGPAARKSNRDTEALVVRGDSAWIGFEGHNMIWRYRLDDWSAQAAARPRAMRRWRFNSGIESLAPLPGRRFVAIAEGRVDSGESDMALFQGDPAIAGTPSQPLRYRNRDGFRPTDAAILPGRGLLVLNRRFDLFRGVAARLTLIELDRLRPGALVEGRLLAELRSPWPVDNMEALDVAVEAGRIIVRIASDDNFIALQRSLLLEFELLEPA